MVRLAISRWRARAISICRYGDTGATPPMEPTGGGFPGGLGGSSGLMSVLSRRAVVSTMAVDALVVCPLTLRMGGPGTAARRRPGLSAIPLVRFLIALDGAVAQPTSRSPGPLEPRDRYAAFPNQADEVDRTIASAARGVDAPASASGRPSLDSPLAPRRGDPPTEPGSRIPETDRQCYRRRPHAPLSPAPGARVSSIRAKHPSGRTLRLWRQTEGWWRGARPLRCW